MPSSFLFPDQQSKWREAGRRRQQGLRRGGRRQGGQAEVGAELRALRPVPPRRGREGRGRQGRGRGQEGRGGKVEGELCALRQAAGEGRGVVKSRERERERWGGGRREERRGRRVS